MSHLLKIFFFLFFTLAPALARSQSLKWERVYGAREYEYGKSIEQTSDSGYIVAGTSSSYGAATDMYLIRLRQDGSFGWHKVFSYGNDEWACSVRQTPSDSGFIICGYTNSIGNGGYDIYLVKTDSLGNELWHRTFGGSDWDFGYSVDLTNDGGYILAGSTFSYGAGGEDAYLVKTDASGNLQWQQTFGGFEDDNATQVKQAPDGGYILSARTKSFSLGDYDMWTIKTDAAGSLQWNHTYGSVKEDGFNSVALTSDGGYVLGGYTYGDFAGIFDNYILKLDASGNTQHVQNDAISSGSSSVQSVCQTYNGMYFTVGYTTRVSSDGNDFLYMLWDQNLNFVNASSRGGLYDEFAWQGQQTNDTGYVMVGSTETWGNGKSDIYVVKIDKNFNASHLPVLGTNEIAGAVISSMNIFPDPANTEAYVTADENLFKGKGEAEITDMPGRQVWIAAADEIKNNSGKLTIEMPVSRFSPGIYLFTLRSEAGTFSQKFIVKH